MKSHILFFGTSMLVVGIVITTAVVSVRRDVIHADTALTNRDSVITANAGGLDWCVEHRVPESVCTQCNPALIGTFMASGDWCADHGVPESHCRLCNPNLTFPPEVIPHPRSPESADTAITVSLFFRPNAAVCATDGALIQFASARTAEKSGISIQQVVAAPYESVLEAPAEVVFDESNKTVIATAIPVLVVRWQISPGEVVRQGDILAIVQSSEMPELQAKLLSTHVEYQVQQHELDRHEELKARRLVSESDYERQAALAERAHAEFTGARGLLLSTGISDQDIDALIETGTISHTFALRAPGDGLVAQRIAQPGELLEGGRALAVLVDPSAMWIEAQLTKEQIKAVSVGQLLSFASDGWGLDRVGGKVIWVSPFLDSHTRTGTVRAGIIGPTRPLQAGEFGRVAITHARNGQTALIPKDAVQWEGCCNVVFVKESVQRYRPRKVQLADGRGSHYQVIAGLQPGEEIVVDGSFLLKTELKKTSIGAGCCGIEPAG
jgi:cobalt-zinc-cadmium efflux system membrane fusion protein